MLYAKALEASGSVTSASNSNRGQLETVQSVKSGEKRMQVETFSIEAIW